MGRDLHCLAAFFMPPAGSTLWGAINSPIVVALMAAIFAWLLKDRVQEIVQDAAQTRALEDQMEAEPQQIEPAEQEVGIVAGPTVPFAQAAAVIDAFKRFVDRKASAAQDGRNRRKYNNFQRYDYAPLVKALIADRNLDDKLGSQLIDAFEKWRPYRTGRVPVPQELFDALRLVQAQIEDQQAGG